MARSVSCFEAGFEDEIDEVFADVDEFGGEVFGDEDGGFGNAEFDGAGVAAVEIGKEVGVVLAREGCVEGFSQCGDHIAVCFNGRYGVFEEFKLRGFA